MKLTVSLAQMEVASADPRANLRKAEGLMEEAARRGSDLLCFPEMWTTGFDWSYNERAAAEHDAVIARIGELAASHRLWVNGSTLERNEEGRVSNTSIVFNPNGERVATYRKAHLFSFMRENEHMAPGRSLATVETPWGLWGLSICYDIRFPELFRTYALKGVKVQLSPMAFPHPRLEHWKILSRARAIENQMFLVGINQVGSEDFGKAGSVTYFGSSCIIDPWGQVVAEAGEREETLLTASIDVEEVDRVRGRMRVFDDRRPDLYEL